MGMRGNIQINQPHLLGAGTSPVFLYTHWRGHQVNEILADAINKAGGRCSDPSYFTRIVFQEMIGDDKSTESFGISVGVPDDNEYPIPRVFWDNMKLQVELEGEIYDTQRWLDHYLKSDLYKDDKDYGEVFSW